MINAFLISSELSNYSWEKARSHLVRLASKYSKDIQDCKIGIFRVCFVGSEMALDVIDGATKLTLSIRHADRNDWDRFINIEIKGDYLSIENDYAGTVPLFYSARSGFVASNIEPCVFLGSGASIEDVSPQNVYGFLKYSHFIWDETAWTHVFQMLPDSRYIFTTDGQLKSSEYLATVKASSERCQLSDKDVATQLLELNRELVTRSFVDAGDIILPLSSGYDSRMIFAVLANDPALAKITRCFSYGSEGSIEVEGGRRLSRLKDISWQHIELPCRFLQHRYLKDAADIFGASLHMHGMYQIEFYEQIRSLYGIPPNSVLTSGFMTGVPAGQHNGLLQIENGASSLVQAMNRFSQSKVWNDDELKQRPLFHHQDFINLAESRFRAAFNRFDGEIFQKAVMFDVWTRQRNFISYYPRTLEWLTPVASPHMNAEYANFFMSLSREHLWNRKAVELMFLHHYPDISRVASNSNGLSAIGNPVETALFFVTKVLNKFRIPNPLPKQYRNTPFDFDTQAIINSEEESFFPLLESDEKLTRFVESMGGIDFFRDCYKRALSGDTQAYAQVVTMQSIAHNGLLD